MGEVSLMEREWVFMGDREYLETYSGICRCFNERYEILEDISKHRRVRPKEREDRELALGRLKELNRIIQDSEWYFWEKVECSAQRGVKFILEEFAKHYGLCHLEKRIVLFFLCSWMLKANSFALSEFWLVEIFDIAGSVTDKVRNLSLFKEDRHLISNEIMVGDESWHSDSYTTTYRLNTKFLNLFSRGLEGLSIEWPEAKKEKTDDSKTEEVGFIKEPDYSFNDVILPDETKEKMDFFLKTYKSDAFQKLGVDKVIKKGKGLSFLFYGPPGTGKSMLAEAIASSVGMKMLVVETPKIFSCWLGQTDKNIQKMFERAKEDNLVLLLDEADSLLYSRGLVSAYHTVRFTNVMLTELERFDGIAVFTSNMDDLLDEAMERRIALKVKFDLPKPKERAYIWESHMPPKVKLAEDVDFNLLGEKYDFSGGEIKNAVLNAIRRIVHRNSDILTMEDLIFGGDTEKNGMFHKKQNRRFIGFKGNP